MKIIRSAPLSTTRHRIPDRVSRSADTPGSVPRGLATHGSTTIYLGTTLPQPSSSLPGNGTGSPIVPCLTLLRTRFTEPITSPRPLVGSYPTVSPLPRTNPGRSVFCGTVSRVTPGGCYPPSCPVEPGRSSTPLCQRHRMSRPSGRPTQAPSLSVCFWSQASRRAL